jgi:excisionase family DNA binding protein
MSAPIEYVKVQDIAASLNLSVMKVHNIISSGALPAIDIGKGKRSHWRVSRADLEEYLADQKAETARRFERAAS